MSGIPILAENAAPEKYRALNPTSSAMSAESGLKTPATGIGSPLASRSVRLSACREDSARISHVIRDLPHEAPGAFDQGPLFTGVRLPGRIR